MVWLEHCAVLGLISLYTFLAPVSAQEIPALSISPARVTILQGETRTFRAVGKDGRIRHNVRWTLSPENAAKLTNDGDEAVVQAGAKSSTATLTAYTEGDSAEATVDVRSGPSVPPGTVLWTVAPLPGCKSTNLTQAVPTASGPDLYDDEECPQGRFIRALTADGRELWRRQLTGAGGILSRSPVAKPPADAGQHLELHRTSVCDDVARGMTKDEVSKVVDAVNLDVGKKQWQSDNWDFEEEGSRCAISFDAGNGTVVKKKKTVVTD